MCSLGQRRRASRGHGGLVQPLRTSKSTQRPSEAVLSKRWHPVAALPTDPLSSKGPRGDCGYFNVRSRCAANEVFQVWHM